jgi:hypothetical protein
MGPKEAVLTGRPAQWVIHVIISNMGASIVEPPLLKNGFVVPKLSTLAFSVWEQGRVNSVCALASVLKRVHILDSRGQDQGCVQLRKSASVALEHGFESLGEAR